MFGSQSPYQKLPPLIQKKIRKWFSNKLNPFNLCPISWTYWIVVYPYSAIGVSIADLHNIVITWRQQIEPNETSYLNFNIIQLRVPFPLTLLVQFSLFGVTMADAAFRVLEGILAQVENTQQETEKSIESEKIKELRSFLDPFRLTPRLSIFFPVTQYTSIGFLTIDFRHIEYSIAQAIEPNGNIENIFRLFDFYAPFPVQVTAMILSLGLFLNGVIYKYKQEIREALGGEVK